MIANQKKRKRKRKVRSEVRLCVQTKNTIPLAAGALAELAINKDSLWFEFLRSDPTFQRLGCLNVRLRYCAAVTRSAAELIQAESYITGLQR